MAALLGLLDKAQGGYEPEVARDALALVRTHARARLACWHAPPAGTPSLLALRPPCWLTFWLPCWHGSPAGSPASCKPQVEWATLGDMPQRHAQLAAEFCHALTADAFRYRWGARARA